MPLTEAIKQAYADPDIGEDPLHTLSLDHVSFPAPIRIVANSEIDLTLPLETGAYVLFTACPVSIVLQGFDDDGPTQGQMRIDNVSKILQPGLRAAVQAGRPLTLFYRGYLMSFPGAGPQDIRGGMNVSRVSLYATFAMGTIETNTKADRQAFPLITYDVAQYKALHGLF